MSKPIKPPVPAAAGTGAAEGVSTAFIHRIRVHWADCDPASIAYTGQIPRFALEAIEAWWERHAGLDWYQLNLDRNIGTPFVHMTLDFRSPVTPRHLLECQVALVRLGNSSITHRVTGSQNGVLCFEGEFVAAFVDAKAMKPRRLPADILCAIERNRSPE
ncbi:MAG: thioesterase family protein [Rhodomicrobiaceae bacterium]